MTSTEINTLRAELGKSLGFGSWFSPFDGGPAAVGALSADDRLRLNRALWDWSQANPGRFTELQTSMLRRLLNWPAETSYGVGDAAADFLGEVGNQAADLNQTLNPFSERNRGYVLAAVAVGLVLYYAGPAIIAALKKK